MKIHIFRSGRYFEQFRKTTRNLKFSETKSAIKVIVYMSNFGGGGEWEGGHIKY